MGAFASALQGIGQTGENIAGGKQILDQWRNQNAVNKINLLASQLRLKELQDQIKQAGLPQNLGIVTGRNGEQLAVSRDPNTGKISTSVLVPGYDPQTLNTQANNVIQSLPENLRPLGKGIYDMYASTGDLQGGLKALGTLSTNIAEKMGAPKKPINYKTDAYGVTEITDQDGVTYTPTDPNLPANLKEIVSKVNADTDRKRKQSLDDEARKNAEALSRAFQLADYRELQKARDDLRKKAERGVAGHSFYKTIQAQVERAARTGGEGTTAGDMLITESFMQLMFGVDPKALRGSPKMMEIMMKQGGVTDRIIAQYNNLIAGGKLSQGVRQEMLDEAQDQLESWDAAVNMTGQMTDDPVAKKIVDKYLQVTGNDAFSSASPTVPPPPVPNAVVTKVP